MKVMAYHSSHLFAGNDNMQNVSIQVLGYETDENSVLFDIRTRVVTMECETESQAWRSVPEIEEALGLEGSDAPEVDGDNLEAACNAIEKLLGGHVSSFESVDDIPSCIRNLLAMDQAVICEAPDVEETELSLEDQNNIARVAILRTLARVIVLLKSSLDQVEIFGQMLLVSAVAVDMLRRYASSGFHYVFPWVLGSAGGSVLISHWIVSKVVRKLRMLRRRVKGTNNPEGSSEALVMDSAGKIEDENHGAQEVQPIPFNVPESAPEVAVGTETTSSELCEEEKEEAVPSNENVEEAYEPEISQLVEEYVEMYETLYKSGEVKDLYERTLEGVKMAEELSESVPTPLLYWVCIGAEQYGSDLLRQEKKDEALEVLSNGVQHGEKAISLAPNDSKPFKYLAIVAVTHGRAVGGTEAKIKSGIRFYELTKRAIELNPEDPTNHFLMGKFQYEVAFLSWVERKLAGAIFGAEPPYCTVEEAQKSFQAAVKRRNGGIASTWDQYEISRCLIAQKMKDEARECLEEALGAAQELEDPSADDTRAIKAVEELLATL